MIRFLKALLIAIVGGALIGRYVGLQLSDYTRGYMMGGFNIALLGWYFEAIRDATPKRNFRP